MNQYKKDPIDFKPSKLYFENENEMIDEFCRHCCGYIPTNNEGDDCCYGCNELDEMISDYSANFENDRSGISKIIDSQQARITELESKLRWIPVTERLPEHENEIEIIYILFGEERKIFGWYDMENEEFRDHHGVCMNKVKCWREVPEL